MPDRNRAILLTAPGVSAIAVVRLLGAGVGAFLARRFSRPVAEGRCVYGRLSDAAGAVIDDPVVVGLPGGGGADVSLHGGAWVVRAVLDLAAAEGFEVEGRGGDLPLDAFDGATLIDREVSAALPLARTELAVRALISQPAAWATLVGSAGSEGGRARIDTTLEDRSLWWLLHPPRVAVVGAPNVGKSTLANRLFAAERAITADLPGTTRDWVGERADLDGLVVTLVDTPGVRATADPIEAAAIAAAGEQVRGADLVVVVLDGTRPLAGEQEAVLGEWPGALVVVNKADGPAAWDWSTVGGIRTVGTTGAGVDECRAAIRGRFGITGDYDVARPRWWTERQRGVLRDALTGAGGLGRMVDDE